MSNKNYISLTCVFDFNLVFLQGLGTDDAKLIRVVISRSEIDMVQIKQAFANMYGQTLGRFISVGHLQLIFLTF